MSAQALRKDDHAAESVKKRLRARALRKFLHYFPDGFQDETYFEWERGYKWRAHLAWKEKLSEPEFSRLIRRGDFLEIAAQAVRVESRTNLLFSFEKMALRDAVRDRSGAQSFAVGLYEFLYGAESLEKRFAGWARRVADLPRKQTRVLTWPVLTVFPFIAEPAAHVFLKPNVTRAAAEAYGFEFPYSSKAVFSTYQGLLRLAAEVKRDTAALKPRDMIDLQSFIWVQGSEEYPARW